MGFFSLLASDSAGGGGASGYVSNVQHFAITIGPGNLTATETIDSVDTSKSFVIFGSNTLSASSASIPRLELTNATTVTATRNGTSDTMVVYGCVVEGTSNLIDTVQQGTISMTGASQTATDTITSVDTSRSAVFYLGASGSKIAAVELTNATTVTASIASSASTQTVGYVVVEFAASAINNVEKSINSFSDSSVSNTDTLATSVTVANTMLAYGGESFSNYFRDLQTTQLTATDTLTFTRDGTDTTTRNINITVIEFVSGVVNARYGGEIDMQNVTSNIATITEVDTSKTALGYLGWRNSIFDFVFDTHYQGVGLTNSTTVTGHIGTSTNASMAVSYEAVEFN